MAQPIQKPVEIPKLGMKKLLQNAPGAILELDQNGDIVFASRAAAELFGYRPAELLGETLAVLVPEVFSGARGLEFEAVRKDGQYFPVEIAASQLKSASGPRTIVALRDLSDSKRLEDRLQAFESCRRELEQHNRDVETFLGNVRHTLRSPLSTVVGFAELLEEETEGLTEKQKRFLAHIRRESLHMLELVNESSPLE